VKVINIPLNRAHRLSKLARKLLELPVDFTGEIKLRGATETWNTLERYTEIQEQVTGRLEDRRRLIGLVSDLDQSISRVEIDSGIMKLRGRLQSLTYELSLLSSYIGAVSDVTADDIVNEASTLRSHKESETIVTDHGTVDHDSLLSKMTISGVTKASVEKAREDVSALHREIEEVEDGIYQLLLSKEIELKDDDCKFLQKTLSDAVPSLSYVSTNPLLVS